MSTILSSTIDNDEQLSLLLQRLKGALPYSIPLTRRIQFHVRYPSPTAKIFTAVCNDNGSNEGGDGTARYDNVDSWLRSDSNRATDACSAEINGASLQSEQRRSSSSEGRLKERDEGSDKPPWLAAHIDLANSGQTQVWLFASWEQPTYASNDATSQHLEKTTARAAQTQHKALIASLFDYLRTELVPLLANTPSEDWLELQRTGKYLSVPYSRNKILFGTVHEALWECFPSSTRTRIDLGYLKYIFEIPTRLGDHEIHQNNRASSVSLSSSDMPRGIIIRPLKESEYHTVLDRTPIPRTKKTLREIVSLGVYDEGSDISSKGVNSPASLEDEIVGTNTNDQTQAIGWGFLGKDASLSSLHTEPAYRGKGLAVILARELLTLQQPNFYPAYISLPSSASAPASAANSSTGHVTSGRRPDKMTNETLKSGSGDGSVEDLDDGWQYGHADVSESNVGSRRVMEKLGGKIMWRVAWIEVDLDKIDKEFRGGTEN